MVTWDTALVIYSGESPEVSQQVASASSHVESRQASEDLSADSPEGPDEIVKDNTAVVAEEIVEGSVSEDVTSDAAEVVEEIAEEDVAAVPKKVRGATYALNSIEFRRTFRIFDTVKK